jgi:hypothetical protein
MNCVTKVRKAAKHCIWPWTIHSMEALQVSTSVDYGGDSTDGGQIVIQLGRASRLEITTALQDYSVAMRPGIIRTRAAIWLLPMEEITLNSVMISMQP